MQRQIIHPDFYKAQALFYPQRATFQQAQEVQSETGQVNSEWVNVSSLVDLSCQLANIAGTERSERQERRRATYTGTERNLHLSLTALHRDIVDTMRVIVTDEQKELTQILNITGVDHDVQSSVTRVRVEKVSA